MIQSPVTRRVLFFVVGAVVVGGIAAAVLPFRTPDDVASPAVSAPSSAFGAYFTHFFPGRTSDGSKPKSSSVLLRADKFLAGEQAGLRVQTAVSAPSSFLVEVRFLGRSSHEERPALRDARQRFRIRSGLRTYCCLRMPRISGDFSLGVLVEGQYVTFLPITVKPLQRQGEGGLFTQP